MLAVMLLAEAASEADTFMIGVGSIGGAGGLIMLGRHMQRIVHEANEFRKELRAYTESNNKHRSATEMLLREIRDTLRKAPDDGTSPK